MSGKTRSARRNATFRPLASARAMLRERPFAGTRAATVPRASRASKSSSCVAACIFLLIRCFVKCAALEPSSEEVRGTNATALSGLPIRLPPDPRCPWLSEGVVGAARASPSCARWWPGRAWPRRSARGAGPTASRSPTSAALTPRRQKNTAGPTPPSSPSPSASTRRRPRSGSRTACCASGETPRACSSRGTRDAAVRDRVVTSRSFAPRRLPASRRPSLTAGEKRKRK